MFIRTPIFINFLGPREAGSVTRRAFGHVTEISWAGRIIAPLSANGSMFVAVRLFNLSFYVSFSTVWLKD